MTDITTTPIPTLDTTTWEMKAREQARLSEAIRPANKTALFDALVRAGITIVIVRFDGYGDSGQIEDIEAKARDAPTELPGGEIELLQVTWGAAEAERSTLSIRTAIETLAYDFLEETHGGWENSDGAYGDFVFDVENRTITLEYNERHMESDYSEHVF